MTLQTIFEILSSWQLAAICAFMVILLPTAYSLGSRRRKSRRRTARGTAPRQPTAESEELEEADMETDEADLD